MVKKSNMKKNKPAKLSNFEEENNELDEENSSDNETFTDEENDKDEVDDIDEEEEEIDEEDEEIDEEDEDIEGEDKLKVWDEGEDEEIEDENNEGLEEEEEEEEEVESDEDNDDDDQEVKGGAVTKVVIKQVTNFFKNNQSLSAIKNAQNLLNAAILSIKGSADVKISSPYKLEGSEMFNAVVNLCLTHVAPCLLKSLGMANAEDKPKKNSSKWKKLALPIKRYINGLIVLLKMMTDPVALQKVLSRGILPLLSLYKTFPITSWTLFKQLTKMWSTSEEAVRVSCVLGMFRLMRGFDAEHHDKALKMLYMSYVKNCTFTSPTTWPLIHFMRVSLAELYNFDHDIAYTHAFIYIRQLALHLRNAFDVDSPERIRLVANWQYLHCLHLWAELLGKSGDSKVLNPLIYPLVQVCIGSMNLMKAAKFYPYTFHVCQFLTELSKNTTTFIPIAPHLLHILDDRRLFVRSKKSSMKPFVWACIIKVSPSQMEESAFQDGLVEQIHDCLLQYTASMSNFISFPEVTMILTNKLKNFCRKCKISILSRKLKQLSDKITENATMIEKLRKDVTFSLKDTKAIKNWEIETSQKNLPLEKYLKTWLQMKEKESKLEGANGAISFKEPKAISRDSGKHLLTKRDAQDLESDDEEDFADVSDLEDDESIEQEEEEIVFKQKKRKSTSNSEKSQKQPKKKRKLLASNPTKKDTIRPLELDDDSSE